MRFWLVFKYNIWHKDANDLYTFDEDSSIHVASNVDKSFAVTGSWVVYSVGCTCFFHNVSNEKLSTTVDEPIIQIGANYLVVMRSLLHTISLTIAKSKIHIKSLSSNELNNVTSCDVTDITTDEVIDMRVGEGHILLLTNIGHVYSYGDTSKWVYRSNSCSVRCNGQRKKSQTMGNSNIPK